MSVMDTMDIAVIEVHRVEDGRWEALERHIFSSDDLDTVDTLEDFTTEQAWVKLAGAEEKLTVYLTGDDEGLVRMDEAYPQR